MKQAIKTVTLDPAVWNREHKFGGSYLLAEPAEAVDGRRSQCCIGVACTALGVPDDAIRGLHYPHYINRKRLPLAIRKLAKLERTPEVYFINDSAPCDTDAERVKQLNADLKKNDIPIRFRLKKAKVSK